MARSSKEVDLIKGLIPVDPEAVGLLDDPYILDGKNIMPTPLGYMSFFGKDITLGLDTLPTTVSVQEILPYQTDAGDAILLALTSQGLYMKTLRAEDSSPSIVETGTEVTITLDQGCSWVQVYTESGGLWTYALIKNKLYLYQRGMTKILYLHGLNREEIILDKLDPTFLNNATAKVNNIELDVRQEGGNSTYKTITIDGEIYKTTNPDSGTHMVRDFNNRYIANLNSNNELEAYIDLVDHIEGQASGTFEQVLDTMGNAVDNPPVMLYETDATSEELTTLTLDHNGSNWEFNYEGFRQTHTYLAITVTNIVDASDASIRTWDFRIELDALEDTNDLITKLSAAILYAESGDISDTAEATMTTIYRYDEYNAPLYSPDGTMLIMIKGPSPYDDLEVYDTSDWSLITSLPFSGKTIVSMQFSPDSSLLVVGHGLSPYMRVYNTSDWSMVSAPADPITNSAYKAEFNPAGTLCAISYSNSPYIKIYTTSGWTLAYSTALAASYPRTMKFTIDGAYFIIGLSASPYIAIWNTSTWARESDPATLPIAKVRTIDISSDGNYLSIASYSSGYKDILVYNVGSWTNKTFPAGAPAERYALYSPDSSILVVLNQIAADSILVYDAATLNLVAEQPVVSWDTGQIISISFSNDGRYLIFGLGISASSLVVLRTSDWIRLSDITGYPSGYTWAVGIMPDSSTFYTVTKVSDNNFTTSVWQVPGLPAPTVVDATAYVQDTIKLKYYALDGVIPTTTIAQDGSETYTIVSNTNELIGLAHIVGISAARGRLVAWDYLNAIHWSSSSNLMDFEPSLETRANVLTVDDVAGQIRIIKPYGEGFLILATGNIVRARYENTPYVYRFKAIHGEGIINAQHAQQQLDNLLVWTKSGFLKYDINSDRMELMYPEFSAWLRTRPIPIRLINMGTRFIGIAVKRDNPSKLDSRDVGAHTASLIREIGSTALAPYPVSINLSNVERMYIHDAVLEKLGILDDDIMMAFSLDPVNEAGYAISRDYQSDISMHDAHKSLACIGANGLTYVYNDNPTDAELVMGRYHQSRSGTTKLTDVVAEFVDYPDNTIDVEVSIDGRVISSTESSVANEAAIQNYNLTPVGKWFNIVLKGRFNLRRLLIRGFKHGIR